MIVSLFDPIRFLAPFLIRAKILLLQVWYFSFSWDDALPLEPLEEWSNWHKELDRISHASPVSIIVFQTVRKNFIAAMTLHYIQKCIAIELHVFKDTSKQAFFSVAYFRFCYTSGVVKCAFATAKTWVAPKKPLSMPKLELRAAILSACKVIVFSNQGT